MPPECEMIAKMEMILRYIDATMDGRECQWGKAAIWQISHTSKIRSILEVGAE